MTNKTRELIMNSAKELLSENARVEGVTLSLEAVARRAGLSKPGLMYHFPTKKALMRGLVEFAAEEWVARLGAEAGESDPARLSPFDRHRAYVRTATSADLSRADYWIFSDALYHELLHGSWQDRLEPWFALGDLSSEAGAALTAARFCADGAWAAEATGVMPAKNLVLVGKHALHLIDQAEEIAEKS